MSLVTFKLLRGALFLATLPIAVGAAALGRRGPVPEVVEVDPADLTKSASMHSLYMSKWNLLYRVRGGDWDRETERWEEKAREVYESCLQRYVEGKEWEDTIYYTEALKGIDRDDTLYAPRFDSREDVEAHFSNLDSIYADIEGGEYLRAIEVFRRENRERLASPRYHLRRLIATFDDIGIHFDRNGDPLFSEDGTHRLCLAKVAGIDAIPSRVNVRHEDWVHARRRILDHVEEHGNPHPVPHPDVPFDDPELRTAEVRGDLDDLVVGDAVVEYLDYVFPFFGAGLPERATYAVPSDERFERLNAPFFDSETYSVEASDSPDAVEENRFTAILTSRGRSPGEDGRSFLARFRPERAIFVRRPDESDPPTPAAYSLASVRSEPGVELVVYDRSD